MSKPILVTGATGLQGGAVTTALLNAGFSVRALVRDPKSPAAVALVSRDVELATGDFDDASTLSAATMGSTGVFSVQLPPTDPKGYQVDIPALAQYGVPLTPFRIWADLHCEQIIVNATQPHR